MLPPRALENTYLGHTQLVIGFQNFQIHHNLTELFMMVPESYKTLELGDC